MLVEKLTWIGEPSEPYDEEYKEWPRWTMWAYKMEFSGKECETTFYMGIRQYEIYIAEKAIHDKFNLITGELGLPLGLKIELLELIEAYGDRREEKGRYDVNEEWAERSS